MLVRTPLFLCVCVLFHSLSLSISPLFSVSHQLHPSVILPFVLQFSLALTRTIYCPKTGRFLLVCARRLLFLLLLLRSIFVAVLCIVRLCTFLHCLCIRHCLYMSSKHVSALYIVFFLCLLQFYLIFVCCTFPESKLLHFFVVSSFGHCIRKLHNTRRTTTTKIVRW